MKKLLIIFLQYFIISCQQVEVKEEYSLLTDELKRLGLKSHSETPHQGLSDKEIMTILNEGLTIEEAQGLALANNKDLHEEIIHLGVEKAEQAQTYLLSNPGFDLSILFPEGGGRSNLALSLMQNIAEIWQLPVKKEISAKKIKASIYKIVSLARAKKILVKDLFYEILSLDENLKNLKAYINLREQAVRALTKKKDIGATTTQDVLHAESALFKLRFEEKSISLQRLELMNQLKSELGITLEQKVSLQGKLEQKKLKAYTKEEITKAVKNEPSLLALSLSIEAFETEWGMQKNNVFDRIELGFARERLERRGGDGPGINVISGPLLSVELPVFHQKQHLSKEAEFRYKLHVKKFENQYLKSYNHIFSLLEKKKMMDELLQDFKDKIEAQVKQRLSISEKAYKSEDITLIQYLQIKEDAFELMEKYSELLLKSIQTQVEIESYMDEGRE